MEIIRKAKPFLKGTFVVIFGVNAALTANPVKVELVDQADTHLLWVVTADYRQREVANVEPEEDHPKFQVVLPGSGETTVLYA